MQRRRLAEKTGLNADAKPLPKSQRRAIAEFTKGDIGKRGLEHCLAVLMREGIDLRVLRQFEGLTRARIRETVESVMQRSRMQMDRQKTLEGKKKRRKPKDRPLVDWDRVEASED